MNTETSEENVRQSARRKRVNRLKKMILITVFLLITIPTILCVCLGIHVSRLNNTIENMTRELDWLEKSLQSAEDEADRMKALLGYSSDGYQNLYDENHQPKPDEGAETSNEEATSVPAVRKVYLTFDDGPSDRTRQILDILDEYHVKATFFVVGKTDDTYRQLYQEIVDRGHLLGMHSYSHKYSNIYSSPEAFEADLEQIQQLLLEETGIESKVYRFPGGSSNTVSRTDIQTFIKMLSERGIVYYDWNVSAGDAQSGYRSKDQIVRNVVSGVAAQEHSIVLMHDANDKGQTVDALPEIIEQILAMDDVSFSVIDEDTPNIQHVTADAVQ